MVFGPTVLGMHAVELLCGVQQDGPGYRPQRERGGRLERRTLYGAGGKQHVSVRRIGGRAL